MTRQPTVPMRMLVIISIAVAALLLLASAVYASGSSIDTVSYRVEAGDSLWSIATDAVPDRDVRSTIDTIRTLNGIEGSLILPGQVLQLPSS